MKRKSGSLNILFVSAESFPLVKVGGLADVAGSLPKALARLGHDVRVALPYYSSIDLGEDFAETVTVPVRIGNRTAAAEIVQAWHPAGVPAYLVKNDAYFGREDIYGYPDDDERFIFFGKAVTDMLPVDGWVPDVIHCNDWHCGHMSYYLRTGPSRELLAGTSSVFTIHNLAYQGPFVERTRELLGLPDGADDNMMAAGIRYADAINTVSPSYLSEILMPEFGENMDTLLQTRLPDLRGILNGIDEEEFDPKSDPRIPIRYDARSVAKKAKDKTVLQHWSQLPIRQTAPLVGVVCRLTEQKGIDLICQALEDLLEMGIQLVIAGRGDASYEEMVAAQAERQRGAVTYHRRDDEVIARLIYAGADMLLAPSNFEPCGLGPLIAIRYGTVPVVRATGGLADTIIDYSADPVRGQGFSFTSKSPKDLAGAVERALLVYYRKAEWLSLIRRLMAEDFSWDRSSRDYLELYRHALAKRPRDAGAKGAVLTPRAAREPAPRRIAREGAV